jgi:dipeptidyl aminopeptidase/acylaminoacyl peptidase
MVFSPDSRHLLFSFSGATRASDIYAWDLLSNHLHPLTRTSHGGVPVDSFTSPQLVNYPTFDHDASGSRRMLSAWFFKPRLRGPARLPVVVVVHGGPEDQFRPYFSFFIQYLLSHGYAVLAPNVRGSTGYGKSFSHLDDVEKRMDSVADLAHAVHWLEGQPEVDPRRIAVYGGSYGGFMVLSALSTYPDLWAAGVDIVGVSSFVTFLENTSGYRRAHREAEYGSLEKDRQFLESIAPINHVHQMTAPLIVIHGANDPRVPLSEARQLADALTQRGVPVELLVFDDEGHGIARLKNKLVAYPAIVNFLDKHLAIH